MDSLELFERLGAALAIGLLLGIERGWRERYGAPGSRTAGIRTFALTGLFGGICGLLSLRFGGGVLVAGLVAFAGILAFFRYREAVHDRDFGITTLVAGLLTFGLGAYAAVGEIAVAAAVAVVAVALLAAKTALHGALRALTWEELRAGLILAAMTFLFLPILPDHPIDPLGAINPRALWLMTILIAAVSFLGHAAIRIMGPRKGPIAAAAAGGLVSSTAVTLTFSRLAAQHPASARLLAGAMAVSGAVMLARVIVIAAIVNPALLPLLGPPLAAAAGVSALAGFGLAGLRRPPESETGELLTKNPFDLAVVLRFGLLLTVVTVLAHWAKAMLGVHGLLVVAMVTGLADVDAITLSSARMSLADIGTADAALAILAAVAVNTLAKCVLAGVVGTRAVAGHLALASLAALCAGLLAYLIGLRA